MKKLICLVAMVFCFTGIGFAQAEQIALTWDANVEADLAGYRTFMRPDGGVYNYGQPMWEGSGTTTTPITVTAWPDGDYFFVVRAFDSSGNESGDSNEVTYPVDHTPPAPPTGCTIIKTP